MTLRSIGGFAALACAGTYIFGFVLLVTLLAPLGFGTNDIDTSAVVAFIHSNQSLMITWNTGIYIINALALVVLVIALHAHLAAASPNWAPVTLGFGLVWATLVLGAGMIANVAVERIAALAMTDPAQAAQLWEILHAVELGLGGGNEIAGAIWILCVSIAAWRGQSLGKITNGLGVLTGVSGLATIIPAFGETAGAIFGLGAIAWFIAIGLRLTVGHPAS